MENSTVRDSVEKGKLMTSISADDQVWFRQLHALTRREIAIESILGERVFPKCECGEPISRGRVCVKCAVKNLKQFCVEATNRINNIPRIECPQCRRALFTKLTMSGICAYCQDQIDEKFQSQKVSTKPKSLKDKVGSFVSHSQPPEEETEVIPF